MITTKSKISSRFEVRYLNLKTGSALDTVIVDKTLRSTTTNDPASLLSIQVATCCHYWKKLNFTVRGTVSLVLSIIELILINLV